MTKPPQDRGAVRRHALAAGLIVAVAFLFGPAAAGAKPPPGCGAKPGDPDTAAILQYCPKEVPKATSQPGVPGQGESATPSPPPASDGGDGGGDRSSGLSELPLLDYPSTGGINFLLLLLALVALGLAVAYGARRWRRRPRAS